MDALSISLAVSILLCGLVAGLVFTFAVVVMPGIKTLNDHDFLQAFKVMDRIIQKNHPLFVVVWLGSVLAILALCLLGIFKLQGMDRFLIIISTATYLLGVQLPTVAINVPLNNQLQQRNLDALKNDGLKVARESFEPRWVLWNAIRTILAILATVTLIIVAIRV